MITNYDKFNREERAICSHLFRLLHENLDNKDISPFYKFIRILSEKPLQFNKGLRNIGDAKYQNIAIYNEVAIIRDYYHQNKQNVFDFMDNLSRLIMIQENISSDCRLYSQLDDILKNPRLTHPKQIRQKATEKHIELSESEKVVYGAMQGMFNAKPDLVITLDNLLLVFEAKFTEKFDNAQLGRTWKIANVWSELLFADFGFSNKPDFAVIKLGASKNDSDITWEEISKIADETYSENDRTRIVLNQGHSFLTDNFRY
jgi:hypothetical protein